ncbi:sigma-54-dependent transcriptional regulator [Shewanella violacea]|nr:sigma-54 dependent transcriptional regulator [Shewanella violacea]
MKHSIIIADDDPHIITALKLLLKSESYDVSAVTSPEALLQSLKQRDYSLALIDLNYQKDTTSGNEGLDLIRAIKTLDEFLPIVVMTGFSSVDIAVAAMKSGASDFIQKPWDNDRLLSILQTQIRLGASEKQGGRLVEQNTLLRNELSSADTGIIAESVTMQRVLAQIEKLALSDMNILFTGENGTGKSMFADYLHSCSTRKSHAFISVNMGAINENLFESEMFGHVKGAFTDAKYTRIGRFELAQSGTLFLDEIGNIPLSQQGKLLRVLEDHQFEKVGSSKTIQVNVRLVSATNASLTELIRDGRFRQDLLYRLNTVEIKIPPLRDRVADIMPLAQHFLLTFASKYRLPSQGFAEDACGALKAYDWPGNIRELSHIIERAIFLCQDDHIGVKDLGLSDAKPCGESGYDFDNASLEDIEKYIISQRLNRYDNKAIETSASLGLSRSSYYRRLEKYKF